MHTYIDVCLSLIYKYKDAYPQKEEEEEEENNPAIRNVNGSIDKQLVRMHANAAEGTEVGYEIGSSLG